jgi:hypothetical protein
MDPIPIKLPAGFWRNGTEYQAMGRWYDGNLVRWVNGVMRPIKGWLAKTTSPMTGVPRAILAWRNNAGNRQIAVGTHSKLYGIGETGTVTDITPTGFTAGNADSTLNTGYGIALYGSGTYGTPRVDSGTVVPPATWQLDTWGEQLVACCTSDGKLYSWDLNTANDGVAITNAPTGCRGLVVTEERMLMAIGAGANPRALAWCDQEAITSWTPGSLTRAGTWNLQTIGSLQCGRRVAGGVLLFTDVDVHLANYVGYPLVYGFDKVGSACGIIGPNAVAVLDGVAIWMGTDAFYEYNAGVVNLPCDVQDYVFSDINVTQKNKVYAFINSTNGEVWWLYPSSGSNEVDRYVAYNWREKHWILGQMARTCGIDRGVYANPMMVSANGYVYDHETGFTYDGTMPYAQSGPFELGTGAVMMDVFGLIPDEKTSNDCAISFKTRRYPNKPEKTTKTYTIANPTSLHFSARQASLRVTGARLADWRWGNPRLIVSPSGER